MTQDTIEDPTDAFVLSGIQVLWAAMPALAGEDVAEYINHAAGNEELEDDHHTEPAATLESINYALKLPSFGEHFQINRQEQTCLKWSASITE